MSKLLKALALAGAMISCTSASAWAQTPTPSGFVDVPGGKLWYETCGSGARTMVLIHDGVMHSVIWDDVWPRSARASMWSAMIGAAMAAHQKPGPPIPRSMTCRR